MIPILMPGMSYWDCYIMPVQFRRYLVSTYMRLEEQKQERQDKQKPGMQRIAQQGLPNMPPSMDFLSTSRR